MGCFVLAGSNPGLLVRGTIDICKRENVHVLDPKTGKISSVRSESASWFPDEDLGRIRIPKLIRQNLARRKLMINVLYPTVIFKDGKWAIVGSRAAQNRAINQGLFLGVFDTSDHATAYGNRLHLQQEASQRPGG